MKQLQRFGRFALLVAALSLVLTGIITQPTGTGVSAQAGEVAKGTYRSPRTLTYKSDLKTKEAEQQAASAVQAVYRPDVTAAAQQEGKFGATISAVNAVPGRN